MWDLEDSNTKAIICAILTIHRNLLSFNNVNVNVHIWYTLYKCVYIIAVKADEEMKMEQERRVTQDKKDSVHQQLLHKV